MYLTDSSKLIIRPLFLAIFPVCSVKSEIEHRGFPLLLSDQAGGKKQHKLIPFPATQLL